MGALHQAWAPCPAGEKCRQPGQAHITRERWPTSPPRAGGLPSLPHQLKQQATHPAICCLTSSHLLPFSKQPAMHKRSKQAWHTAYGLQERLGSSRATKACTCMALLGAHLGRGLN